MQNCITDLIIQKDTNPHNNPKSTSDTEQDPNESINPEVHVRHINFVVRIVILKPKTSTEITKKSISTILQKISQNIPYKWLDIRNTTGLQLHGHIQ